MLSPYPNFGKPQRWDHEQAARLRQLRGEPEPFSEEFKERYLATLLRDPEWALAVQIALNRAGGAR